MRKHIFFRIDDIASNMNWKNFNSLVAIFKKYGVKPLLLAIPDNKDPEILKYPANEMFWKIVAGLVGSGWSLGQHGYQHLYKTKNGGILDINRKSEFAGIDHETQNKMIEEGKTIMKINGLETEIFSAPAHSFDKNTVLALKENGFKYLSDGIGLFPFRKWGITWLPQTMWRPRKILFGMLTVALHPNTMSSEDLSYLESFIKENRGIIGDFFELISWYKRASFWKRFATRAINIIFALLWVLAYKIKHSHHSHV